MTMRAAARAKMAQHAVRRLPRYARATKPVFVDFPNSSWYEQMIAGFGENQREYLAHVHGPVIADRVLVSAMLRLYASLALVTSFNAVAALSFVAAAATLQDDSWGTIAAVLFGLAAFAVAVWLQCNRRERFPNPFGAGADARLRLAADDHMWEVRARHVRDLPAQLASTEEIDQVLTEDAPDEASIETALALVDAGWDGALGELPVVAAKLSV